MFENKKSIIYITKSKIKLVNVTLGNKPKKEHIDEALWTTDTIESILLKFKKNIKGDARILLSEDFVYVATFSLPADSIINRTTVGQKAQELIPENLAETAWDYKLTEPTTIQVIAVVYSLFEKLNSAIAKTGIRIEAIVPLSHILASFSKNQDVPFLFVFIDEGVLLTLAQKGTVITTKRLPNTIDTNLINQFIAFTKEQFFVEPKILVFCGDTKNIDTAQYANDKLKAEIQNMNPFVSLAYKKDLKGKDEEVLNINLMSILEKDNTDTSSATKKTPNRKNIFIIAIVLVILGIVFGLLEYRNRFIEKTKEAAPASKKTKITITPVLTKNPTPSSTSSAEINISQYTISVLNGSGIEGEATKLSNILKENGYNVGKTGNAESSDYEKTEIRYKEKVPERAIVDLDKLLKTRYDVSIGTKLKADTESDIVIIIGKSIKQ